MAHGSFQFIKHVHEYYFRPCQQPDEVAQEALVPLFQICKTSQSSLRGWVIYPGEWWAQAQARCPASENQAPRLGGSGWAGGCWDKRAAEVSRVESLPITHVLWPHHDASMFPWKSLPKGRLFRNTATTAWLGPCSCKTCTLSFKGVTV